MHPTSIAIFAIVCCCLAPCIIAKGDAPSSKGGSLAAFDDSVSQTKTGGAKPTKQKRTITVNEKLIGAEVLGLGVGLSVGREVPEASVIVQQSGGLAVPAVHGRKVVEYVDQPAYVERVIKPVHEVHEFSGPVAYDHVMHIKHDGK